MSNPIRIVRQGGSIAFTFDRGDEGDEADFVCTIHVKEFKDDTSQITRVIELDSNDKWSGFITSTETDALALGMYRIIAILTDSSTDEEEQIAIRFNLIQKWA